MSMVQLRRTVRHLHRLIVTLALTLGSLALAPYHPASAAPANPLARVAAHAAPTRPPTRAPSWPGRPARVAPAAASPAVAHDLGHTLAATVAISGVT